MAQFLETCCPEGNYRSFEFTSAQSDPWYSGGLAHIEDTVGMIFVADKLDSNGCRTALTVENGEDGVLIYSAEKIRVPKEAVSGNTFLPGDAVYWDGVHGNGVVNAWQSGYLWIGIAVESADADDDDLLVDLHGNHPLAEEAP